MKKEKFQWMLATNIVKISRNFVDTSISKSYHPAGAHAHDRAMKMLKLDCTLQFIEAYQTVLWFQSSLPISCRGVAVGVGRADLRCASRGLNRHLSGFDANPSREKLLSSGFMVRILEFFNFDIQILDSNSSKLWKRSSFLGTGILMIDAS